MTVNKTLVIKFTSWLCFTIISIVVISCSSANKTETAITLSKGVDTIELKDISGDKVSQSISVKKEKDSYLITVTAYFTEDIESPWLTVTKDNRATLVLTPKKTRSGFNVSSETARTLVIRVTGRLSSGETLYVLNNREVIGHIVLP